MADAKYKAQIRNGPGIVFKILKELILKICKLNNKIIKEWSQSNIDNNLN